MTRALTARETFIPYRTGCELAGRTFMRGELGGDSPIPSRR